MISTTVAMEKLSLSAHETAALLQQAQEYTNQGKGLVLKNSETVAKLKGLFGIKPVWLSCELNERLGWQFSQAVFYLRRQGYEIMTLKLSARVFAYKLVTKPGAVA